MFCLGLSFKHAVGALSTFRGGPRNNGLRNIALVAAASGDDFRSATALLRHGTSTLLHDNTEMTDIEAGRRQRGSCGFLSGGVELAWWWNSPRLLP